MYCQFGDYYSTCNIIFQNNVPFNTSWTQRIDFYGNHFNGHVSLPETLNRADSMFQNCKGFNSPVLIPKNVTTCTNMFRGCTSYNQPPLFGSNIANCKVADCSYMFSGCVSLNPSVSHITIPNSVTNCVYMFASCSNLDTEIIIGNNVKNCSNMFSGCSNFNQIVSISNSVTNCENMFARCYNLNKPVTISDSVINCHSMFKSCNHLNQPIHIGNNVTNCREMFVDCYSFEQPVEISDSVTDCYKMFLDCNYHIINNSIIHMGNNVTNCVFMFAQSLRMSPLTSINFRIPEGVDNCYQMFHVGQNSTVNITVPSTALNYKDVVIEGDNPITNGYFSGDIYILSPVIHENFIINNFNANALTSPRLNVHFPSLDQALATYPGLNKCVNGQANWMDNSVNPGWRSNFSYISFSGGNKAMEIHVAT